MSKLTKRIVENAEPRATDFFIWCSELPGFGVRVFASGRRGYVVQYRAGNRSRRMALGAHGRITTEEARKLAIGHLGDVAKGGDPAEDRSTQRKAMTVARLCEVYLDAAERGLVMGKGRRPKKDSTVATDRGRISRHIVPLLGNRLVRDLTSADISRFIRDVTAGKTATVEKTKLRGKAVVEGGAGTAARTTGLLGGILSFGVSEGVMPFNPARGVRRPADNRRQRRLKPDEYQALGKALLASGQERRLQQGVLGVWLLALTGCRLGEIEKLKWDEVDEAGGCFRLSDSKEGASVRPVGQAAFVRLTTITKRADSGFVLPAVRGKGSYGGMPGSWKKICDRAGLQGVTPHTLRHSFASVAGDLGFAEASIAALLGHAAGTVTSRYVHRLDEVLVAAANKVANEVLRQMTAPRKAVTQAAMTLTS